MPLRLFSAVLTLIFVLGSASGARGNVVEVERIQRISIAGISLQLSAKQAFDSLLAAGYATDVTRYADWWQAARSFVKGNVDSPRKSPEGYSEIVLERNAHQLTAIRLTTINPNNPFDADEEVRRVREFLGIPKDARRCDSKGSYGSCVAEDAGRTAAYSLLLMAGNQRYESASRLDIRPVGFDAPSAAIEPRPTERGALELAQAVRTKPF